MNWTGKRVLVTGAGGFIGSNVVEALATRGAAVTAFLRYRSGGDLGTLAFVPREIRDSLNIAYGDLADPGTAAALPRGQDIIVHAAALIGIPYSYVHPVEVVRTNTLGTTYLLEGCRREGIERIVCFSTSEVYGTALYAPIDEDHPLQGQSPYSASKIGSDQIALSYHRSFDLPVAIVRPFNTYGPRQSTRAVIPTIISQALRGGAVKLGAVSPTRDLCYVGDTAEGVVRICESEAALGEVINIGTGREISIGELAQMIFRLIGREPEIVTDEKRLRPGKSEVMRLIASQEKCRRLLGWAPGVTLEEGLGRTIEWIRANPGFFQHADYHV
ncbi:GDP-mannose 4,6-dehydratase [Roseomonas sp. OT10]|uniref:GDP-mannose 4,6-dehydratase n=1 Tax=Roseomonas cutis TaxID=2897332 RepID=UPI001E47DFA2|nr:GDP-mannose 4,6-dehydratase [Roseomonas sp. OT10]UFN49765.1 GDP-mannose 4,6-dehydratase [Roseomonas sp. OT10]